MEQHVNHSWALVPFACRGLVHLCNPNRRKPKNPTKIRKGNPQETHRKNTNNHRNTGSHESAREFGSDLWRVDLSSIQVAGDVEHILGVSAVWSPRGCVGILDCSLLLKVRTPWCNCLLTNAFLWILVSFRRAKAGGQKKNSPANKTQATLEQQTTKTLEQQLKLSNNKQLKLSISPTFVFL